MIRSLIFILALTCFAQAKPSPLSELPALKAIPKEAVFLLATQNPQALRDALAYQTVAQGLKGQKGLDRDLKMFFKVLDPATWTEWGVDGNAPAGVVGFLPPNEGIVLFLGLKDPGKAEAQLQKALGKKKVESQPLGGGRFLKTRKFSVAIRGKIAYLSFGPRRKHAGMAQRILSLGEMESLPKVALFKASIAQMPAAAVGLYMDTRLFVNLLLSEIRGAENKIAASILSPFGALTAWAQPERDGFTASAQIALLKGSTPYKVLRPSVGNPGLYHYLQGAPHTMLNLNIDPKATWSFVKSLVEQAGEAQELQGADVGIRAFLQMGLDDLIGLFSGSFGLGSSGKLSSIQEPEQILQSLNGVLVMGLSNSAKMRDLLSKLTAHPAFAQMFKVEGQGWSFQAPGAPKFSLSIQGQDLVLSNQEIKKNSPKALLPGFSGRLQKILSQPNSIASLFFDFKLLTLIPVEESWETPSKAIPAKMKKNSLYIAKAKLRDSLIKERSALQKVRRVTEKKDRDQLFRHLGQLAIKLSSSKQGLRVDLGLSSAQLKTLASSALEVVKGEMHSSDIWKQQRKLGEQIYKLDGELRNLNR